MRKKKGAQEISNEVLCAEYEAVYHYALSICRNETEAQDLTQETFLKAMNAVESFKGNSSLYTWLCAIAKNLWINRCKKQSREIIALYLVLDIMLSYIGFSLIDYFMDSVSATDISILVLAIIFSLFGIKDVDKKLKNEE